MFVNRIYFLLLFLFGLVDSILSNPVKEGSNISYDIVTTDIGFGEDNSCALRDKYGFIWVGTKSGLQCFDGNSRPVYDSNSATLRGLSNLSVSSLFENGDEIWIGSSGGLYVFDRTENRVYRFNQKTKYGVTISALVEKTINAGQGRIWISTQGQGFFIFNTSDSTLVQNSRHGSFYSDMTIGSNGLLYMASINGLIQYFKPDGEFVGESRLPDYTNDKKGISIESSGRDIWISAKSNLYRLDSADGSIERAFSNDNSLVINAIHARPDGSLLLGTNTGIWRYNTITRENPIRIVAEKKLEEVSDERINWLSDDIEDDIMLVHPTDVLEVLTTKSQAFKFVSLPMSTSGNNSIRAFALNSDKTELWIGSDNGLFLYDTKSGTFVNGKVHAICDKAITSLVIDGNKLWIGTQMNGVAQYDLDKGTMRQFVYNENIPYTVVSNEINSIYRTTSGDIYILTNWGVCRYDFNTDNFPQLTEFGQQTQAIAMQEDSSGGLWIATNNAGVHYRGPGESKFNRYLSDDNIPVSMMHIDSKGRLWASTSNNGMFLYDSKTGRFPHYEISMLNHKPVLFMTDDKSGVMWVGADDLLLNMDDADNISLYNFNRHREWTPVAGVVTSLNDGKSAIGCRNGFLIFDPSKVKSSDGKIKVYPLSLSFPFMDDDSEELNRLGLNKLLYTKDRIKLPYVNNTFTINLAATCPMQMADVRFDYKMEGIDKTWITGMSIPEVTYNNLPAGEYKFMLRPHGVRDAVVSELSISILPPWYFSGVAYLVYSILATFIVYELIVTVRKSIYRKYNRKINELRIQKEREIFEAKSRYFVDLIHEIRTPLMLISLPLEQLTEEFKRNAAMAGKSRNMTYIKSMQRNIDYLLGITNQLLDFRKAENDSKVLLNQVRCNLSVMLSDICRRFEEPMSISGKKLTLSLPQGGDVYASIDVDKSERLFMNLIGNAMKYARHEVEVALVETSADMVSLSFADDGPGVPADERSRIFDTYYQIGNDNVAASLGTGLGLAYAKLITDAHGGKITVGDSTLNGALFTIELPKGVNVAVAESNVEGFADDELEESIDDVQDVTVMLVEDNQDLRDMIGSALARTYKVITAADGEFALGLLAENNIDVIVSDVMMPRMDGMELCRRVKNDIKYSHIPFIILTAKTGDDAHEEGMECGADVYLEKPFPAKQLIHQIANILRTRQLFYDFMRKTTAVEISEVAKNEIANNLNRVDAEFLERLNAIINESITNEEFSIDVLADRLNMSRSSFYRKITGIVGMSPSDYLKNFRLNRASELLCDGCRVTEVSDRVGFTSSSYFAKCFKEKFGVLPSEYVSAKSLAGRAENRQ